MIQLDIQFDSVHWSHNIPYRDVVQFLLKKLSIDHHDERLIIQPFRGWLIYNGSFDAFDKPNVAIKETMRVLMHIVVLAHELVHYRQYLNGELKFSQDGFAFQNRRCEAYGDYACWLCELEPMALQFTLARQVYREFGDALKADMDDVFALLHAPVHERDKNFQQVPFTELQQRLRREKTIATWGEAAA